MKINSAVILGAGKRKCFEKPVGFLEIENTTIIERLITILNSNGIQNITVITGYKKEYYEKLAKEKNINMVFNDRYKWTGTMYSLALAKEFVKDDFLLIESDMLFEERAVSKLLETEKTDCILTTSESGSGDEALFEMKDGNIIRISKDIHQLNKVDGEALGVCKVSIELYKRLLLDFKENKNPFLNYEYAMTRVNSEFPLTSIKIDDLVWSEIDSEKHYKNIKHIIYPKLVRKESEIRKEYTREVVSKALDIDPCRISKIERLGGLTNKNYEFYIDKNKYVARLAGNGTENFIDRMNEKNNAEIAYGLGLDSECIYFDVNTGLKITKFIENAETLNATTGKKQENIELMAEILKTLHNSQKKFQTNFDPFEKTVFYEESVIEAKGKVFDDYYKLKEIFMSLKSELCELGLDNAPCHIDPLAENFIKSGENKMYLIDWEYSANYDSLWDVAAVSLECNFSEDEEEELFKNYFGRIATNVEKRKIYIHKIMQDMFWSMWATAKIAKGDNYLVEWAEEKYNSGRDRIKKYLTLYKK